MRWAVLLMLFPMIAFGQNPADRAEPPLMFSKEPVMTVDQQIRAEWMDGPEAAKKEIARNRRILRQHRFPLGKAVFFLLLGLAVAFVFVFQKDIAELLKRRLAKPKEPAEISREKLSGLDGVENLNDRYLQLGRVVREHIQTKYQIRAKVQTKEELLSQEVLEGEDELKHLFDDIERVVYAKVLPKEEEYEKSRKIVEEFVEN